MTCWRLGYTLLKIAITAADRMLDQIEAEAIRLLDQPLMGRERPELSPGIRS